MGGRGRTWAGRAAVVAVVMAAGHAGPAAATWSILAVDPQTREVGVAGASCSYMVQGIEGVAPGTGILVVQAASSAEARAKGVELMTEGAGADVVLDAMRSPEFAPEEQQYAVILLDDAGKPRVATGAANEAWSGARTGDGFCVQGNTLTDRGVVDRTFAAYEEALRDPGLTMADRLVAAVAAGASSGGDARCGGQRARTAFVKVVRADDHPQVPYLNLVVLGVEEGGPNAVDRLGREYRAWKESGNPARSTQRYVVP
jgi:uncharacterized Ntn-hydrolase superfamily protein